MRPALGAAVVLALGAAVASSALAATINGTPARDRLTGTSKPDVIYGRGGNDRVDGRGGSDLVHGGIGRDLLLGGAGDDRVAAQADGAADTVRCGAGRDIVNAEPWDGLGRDCEVVSLEIARDTSSDPFSQHATQVEPDSFAVGSTIVTAFQSGRYVDGGASAIGFATSRDGGRSWRSGVLPRLSIYSTPAGVSERVSDPVVAYDATHRMWLIASLGVSDRATSLLVSRSRDGVGWDAPVTAARDPAEDYDKEWIVCDNWATSPFRGRCYLSYLDLVTGAIATRTSSDGGRTWSAPAIPPTALAPRAVVNGAQPVVRPDGTLVVTFSFFGWGSSSIMAITSTNGGETFTDNGTDAPLHQWDVWGMRSLPLPSAAVDAAGRVYVAWHDAGFRENGDANDIAVSTSVDGLSWSAPMRIPLSPIDAPIDHFVPGLEVDQTSGGTSARVAITYYSRTQCESPPCPGTDVGLVTSRDGGRTWSRPQRLNAESMPFEWIADTSLGRMLADYISTSYVGGRPIGVFSLASAPVAGEFRQATYAVTRGAPAAP